MNEETTEKRGEVPLNEMSEKEDEPTFESLLDTLGHFGKHQRIIFSLLTLSDIMHSMVLMFLIFSTVVPKWRCLEFEGLNVTAISAANEGLNVTGITAVNRGLNSTVLKVRNATNDTNAENFEKVCVFNGSKCIRFDFDDGYRGIVVEVGPSRQFV